MSAYSLHPTVLGGMRSRARQLALLDTSAVSSGSLERLTDRIVLYALEQAHPGADLGDLVALIDGYEHRVVSGCNLTRLRAICPDTARREIAAMATPRRAKLIQYVQDQRRAMTFGRAGGIIAEVARSYGVSTDDLTGPSRQPSVTGPRCEAIARIRDELHVSFADLSSMFGGRDPTTISNGYHRHLSQRGTQAAEAHPC